MARNRNSTNTTAKPTSMLTEKKLRSVFTPLFSKNQPIEIDENGNGVKGTALLVFQGYLHSTIDWKDESGVEQTEPKFAFVFAVKANDGIFHNIPLKTNYTHKKGNLLDKTLTSMEVSDFIEVIVQDADDEFGTIERIDNAKICDSLENLRGLSYTCELELKLSRKQRPYYEIQINTLKPRLDKQNNHSRMQDAKDTDPNAVFIDWDE